MPAQYTINEVFYSLQGEGVRAGSASVFVRMTGCNLRCAMEPSEKSPGGFDCDTEFVAGRKVTLDELDVWMRQTIGGGAALPAADLPWVVLTGGEPALQLDRALCDDLHARGWRLAIETNGSLSLTDEDGPLPLDWITVSPKVAEHCIRQRTATEVKYVRSYGQPIPKTCVTAEHYLISPAFCGTQVDRQSLDWCIRLVKENPKWRLSVQSHKALAIL